MNFIESLALVYVVANVSYIAWRFFIDTRLLRVRDALDHLEHDKKVLMSNWENARDDLNRMTEYAASLAKELGELKKLKHESGGE